MNVIFDTHVPHSEGGRKMHIMKINDDKCLCGYKPFLFCIADLRFFGNSIDKYLSQSDPDDNFCKRCKKIFFKNQ